MPDIFDTIDLNETPKAKDIFDTISYAPSKAPSRGRSLISAPVKGILKGINEAAEFAEMLTNPLGHFGGAKPPSEFREKLIEQALPTQSKTSEKLLERGGRLATYLVGPGKVSGKLIKTGIAALGGELAEQLGAGKGTQSAIEIASFLSPTTFKGAQKYVSSLYSQADQLSHGAKTSGARLARETQDFLRNLSKGGPAVSKNAAKAQAQDILKKIKRDAIDVKDLTEFKKTINEARGGLYAEQALNKAGKKTAKRYLDQVSKIVDNSLAEYGKRNPEWHDAYKAANEGFGAIENSKRASNWIGRVIKKNPHASGAVLAGALFGHILSPALLVKTGAAYGGLKSVELINRIVKSKVLRKYYADAIKAATKENPGAFLNNMKKLEISLQAEKDSEP